MYKGSGWRLGFVVAFAMMMLALYPQMNLWYERGAKWSGTYAFFDTDEVAYSAYLQALIDGRPRRNDPYTGRDQSEGAGRQQGESIFSIQIVPAYALGLVGRVFNLSASTLFILLMALVGAASALAIFRLVGAVTEDARVGAAAALCVLCLGILVNGQGAVSLYAILQAAYIYLPFLRRYVPGFSFPFYFVMLLFVWRALTAEGGRDGLKASIMAAVCFAVMVYSYFYLWTTAAAQLGCLFILWLVWKPAGWREKLRPLLVFSTIAGLSLVPYFVLLSRRAETIDAVQALTPSRAPDLFRPPEIAGLITLLLLAWGARRKVFEWGAPRTLFTASFALVPFVVFNQQVITGRSLQPVHYEEFIANYVALAGALIALATLMQRGARKKSVSGRVLLWVSLLAFGWGFIETRIATDLFYQFNLPRETIWPAALRVAEAERGSRLKRGDASYGLVLTPDLLQADTLPTAGPQGLLWAPHMHVFSDVTPAENRERFYQHLYYTGVDEQGFRHALAAKNFYYLMVIYGWERANPVLAIRPNPIRPEEDEAETRAYAAYIESFDRARAGRPQLSYLLLAAAAAQTMPNLDRWYDRDGGVREGDFIIYRLTLKP
jgi:hypothetical protein